MDDDTARRPAESMSGLQSSMTRSINRTASDSPSPAAIDSETGSDEQAITAKTQQRNAALATERNSETAPAADALALRAAALAPLADTRLLREALAAKPANAPADQSLASLAAYRVNSDSAAPAPAAEPQPTPGRLTERWMAYEDLGRNLNSVLHRAVMDRGADGMVRMRIFLTPENMGTIEAEVVEGNNSLTVNLVAQSEEVAKLLRDSSSALRDLLTGSGMNQVNVTVGKDSEARQPSNGQSAGASGGGAQNPNEQPKSALSIATSAADGSIDTYV